LELYLLVGRVTDLGSGVYRYVPRAHQLNAEVLGDRWSELWSTVLAGRRVKESAVVFAVTAACERLAERYGARGERYAHIEVGHVVQNIYLQATAMDLGTVVLGSFADAEVGRIFNCPERERPIALMPVGKPR
jgi:SagB-type dehydrogenase family enzyme